MPLQNSSRNLSGTTFFATYVGSSMNPTLREPEIIEIISYDNRPIRFPFAHFYGGF